MPMTRLPERLWTDTLGALREFLSWWSGELRDAWEDWSLRRSVSTLGRGLVGFDENSLVLSRALPQGAQEMGRMAIDGGPAALPQCLGRLLQGRRQLPAEITIVLPDDVVLSREVNLPSAAGRRLKQILAYQLERLMPLRPKLLYHDCAVLSRDETQGRLRVIVTAARRTLVEGLAQAALDAGARRVYVKGPAAEAQALLLRRSRVEPRSAAALLDRRLAWGAAALALLLAVVLGVQYHAENRRLATQVDQLKHSAAKAEELRDALDRRMQRMHFLAGQLQGPGSSQLFAELTRQVPADAWLFQFQDENGQIDIAGFSGNASTVVASLAKSPLFKDAALRTAVKSPGTGERFDIVFHLKEPGP